ncbi:hypothetical protein ACFLZT_04690, partial [Thermodesulfobacteriota bacterium]
FPTPEALKDIFISTVEDLDLKNDKAIIKTVEKILEDIEVWEETEEKINKVVNQIGALMNVVEALNKGDKISLDDANTLGNFIWKLLPRKEGIYEYYEGYEPGYIHHYFYFNREQIDEMKEFPFKAQPYADWIIDEIWNLADGYGANLGKFIGRFWLAFKINQMAYYENSDVLAVHIRSRNDKEGKWALEFTDQIAAKWKTFVGK